MKPFFTAELKPMELDVRGVRSEGPAVDRFTFSAGTPGKGKLAVAGSLAPSGGKLEVTGTDIALAPYNPFVTAFSPYSVGARSALTVHTNRLDEDLLDRGPGRPSRPKPVYPRGVSAARSAARDLTYSVRGPAERRQ